MKTKRKGEFFPSGAMAALCNQKLAIERDWRYIGGIVAHTAGSDTAMPLSDAKCRNARPQERPYKLTDGHGLYMLVAINGSRFWRFNYPRADPPFLLRGVDVLVVLTLAVGLPAWLCTLGFVLAALAAMSYLAFAACGRAVWRWRLRRQVDAALAENLVGRLHRKASNSLNVRT